MFWHLLNKTMLKHTLTEKQTIKLRTIQRSHEKKILGITWKNKIKKQQNGFESKSTYYFETIKMLKWNCAEDVMRTHAFFIFTRTYRYHRKGWKYRLKTNNRYRYSLLFGYRMQKFFTF